MRATLMTLSLVSLACASTSSAPADSGTPWVDPSPIDLGEWVEASGGTDAGAVEWIRELSKAARGEAADLDGDGVRELSALTMADGTKVWVHENGGPLPSFKLLVKPDGTEHAEYYVLNNSHPQLFEDVTATTLTRVYDDDLDGWPDRREQRTEHDAGLVHVVLSVDGGVDAGGWVQTLNEITPRTRDQSGGHCDGAVNMGSDISLKGPAISFSSNPTVACSKDEKAKIAKALECVKDRLDACMREMNPTLNFITQRHLLTDGLVLGCHNPCANKLASTDPRVFVYTARMNLSQRILSMDDTSLCSVMLHEMFHAAGNGMSSGHDDGTDTVYACGNYCGGCSNIGPANPPPTDNENCARCAATPAARRLCGKKEERKEGTCGDDNYLVCHGNLGVNAKCETCGNLHTLDCVGAPLDRPRFNCCVKCPTDADRVNDKECTPPTLLDTCGQPPKHCR